jgi:hypothetical protein
MCCTQKANQRQGTQGQGLQQEQEILMHLLHYGEKT